MRGWPAFDSKTISAGRGGWWSMGNWFTCFLMRFQSHGRRVTSTIDLLSDWAFETSLTCHACQSVSYKYMCKMIKLTNSSILLGEFLARNLNILRNRDQILVSWSSRPLPTSTDTVGSCQLTEPDGVLTLQWMPRRTMYDNLQRHYII